MTTSGGPTRFVLVLILYVAALLWLGLTPKDFRVENDATRTDEGLTFAGRGIAYTRPSRLPVVGDFSIDVAFEPAAQPSEGYSFILAIHDGKADRQLVVGQWRSHVIVLNGDDYDFRRRLPRVDFDTQDVRRRPIFITLTAGTARTRLYANGRLVDELANTALQLPSGTGEGTRLILGNSPSVKNGWSGAIAGAVVREGASSPSVAAAIYREWRERGNAVFEREDALFTVTPGGRSYIGGRTAPGRATPSSRSSPSVHVPEHVRVLSRRFLQTGIPASFNRRALAYDVVINVVGFVPFGALVFVRARHRTRTPKRRARSAPFSWLIRIGRTSAFVAIAAGVVVSLTIEITQAWLPARHSSLLDLGLNALGTTIGVGVALLSTRPRGPRGVNRSDSS